MKSEKGPGVGSALSVCVHRGRRTTEPAVYVHRNQAHAKTQEGQRNLWL